MFKKILTLLTVVAVFAGMTASSVFAVAAEVPMAMTVSASPATFNPSLTSTTISVTTDAAVGALYGYVLYPNNQLSIFSNNLPLIANVTKTFPWYGRSGNVATGTVLPAGEYTVKLFAKNGTTLVGIEQTTITLTTDGGVVNGNIIKNFTLDPSTTWDPSEENLQIEFDLDKDEVDSLTIKAQKGNGSPIDILDDNNVSDNTIREEWDGTDEDGDYISESEVGSEWRIIVTADGEVKSQPITVKYNVPVVSSDSFVTKKSIDPSKDEYTTLVYKVDSAASVTVDVLDGTHSEVTLEEDVTVAKNRWYTVRFYGQDENGDDVDEGSDWKFRVVAKNLTDDRVESLPREVAFDVKEDTVSSGKSNVTNDALEPPVFESTADGITLSYCIDENADMFAAIYKGSSAGSTAKVTLLDYVQQEAGCQALNWNGKDKSNKKLDDGIYTWKLISRTTDSKKDTEIGNFQVGKYGTIVTPEPRPETGNYDCSMYSDMRNLNGTELCDAIGWATTRGIVQGYGDGTFRSYQNITRAEVIKMILEAFQAMLLPANGSNLGFKDLNPYEWYMTYLRTAQFYGMLEGFVDNTAKPGQNIDRAQALKFVLEASDKFAGQLLKTANLGTVNFADVNYSDWYAKYIGAAYTYQLFDITTQGTQAYLYPRKLAQRGEIGLMLYRLNKAGLIK
jgi:flagellar hook assembly protein FlgD